MNANSQDLPLNTDMNHQTFSVGSYDEAVRTTLDNLRTKDFVRRLWTKDPALWHEDPAHQALIRNALGWLTVSERHIRYVPQLQAFADEVKTAGFTHILLLGMGGSSLCPEVFRMTFGVIPGYPELHVLDSTVPSQVRSFEERVDLERTLCIVASKSGSTTEPLVFQKYFFERMRRIKGDRAGENFIAITDPGSLLEGLARELRFRAIFPGMPDIGGRYSALSNFGMVPAAAMGVDVEALLQQAERIRQRCEASVPAPDNPGVTLGAVLGTLARVGRDKVTFITSPAISDLGAWLEQLIAESTGKEGKGLIPVDDEPLGEASVYDNDRVFVYIRYADGAVPEQDAIVDVLQSAGHPVVRIDCTSVLNLGQEFFRWEVATATAGSLLGINAFDQPNVQESKDFTKFYLEEFKKNGRLPEDSPVITDGDVHLFTDDANHQALKGASSLVQAMAAHLSQVRTGDYVAINAYLERTPAVHDALQRIRALIRDAKGVATTLGYGPRFLHSTGQLHKGGPASGVFLQVTADQSEDLGIPDEPYSFGTLVAAQALGDMKSLCTRNRRVIRIHLSRDIAAGVRQMLQAVEESLSFAPPL
ncbi:MAG: bifunctional transaldolase/phosoglucose isomerase [Nitrospira sp.]|nr:bifunctional transaldolase/phosoglucose isomerase [Nitrospira sp.]MDE0486371.1 bifunctional transaldolase/phosoglucose isomerase [Nitrospira sp.]